MKYKNNYTNNQSGFFDPFTIFGVSLLLGVTFFIVFVASAVGYLGRGAIENNKQKELEEFKNIGAEKILREEITNTGAVEEITDNLIRKTKTYIKDRTIEIKEGTAVIKDYLVEKILSRNGEDNKQEVINEQNESSNEALLPLKIKESWSVTWKTDENLPLQCQLAGETIWNGVRDRENDSIEGTILYSGFFGSFSGKKINDQQWTFNGLVNIEDEKVIFTGIISNERMSGSFKESGESCYKDYLSEPIKITGSFTGKKVN